MDDCTCVTCGKEIPPMREMWSYRGHVKVVGPSCSPECHIKAIEADRGFKPTITISNGGKDHAF